MAATDPSMNSTEIERLLRKTGALLDGHFRLSSGLHSDSYVQCARLLEHPDNASRIGVALADRLRTLRPDRIVSPALGGIVVGYVVAAALGVPFLFTERKDGLMMLRRGFNIDDLPRVIIVEDVVTTGKSTMETADVVTNAGGNVIAFASILNRSGRVSPFPLPFEALLSLDLPSHPEGECPLCQRGVPIESPGSRHAKVS